MRGFLITCSGLVATMLVTYTFISDAHMREPFQDGQSAIPSTFAAAHSVTLLQGVPGMPESETEKATKMLVYMLRSEGSQVVYMGRASPSGAIIDSARIQDPGISAVVIAEHGSVEEMQKAFGSPTVSGALAWFENYQVLTTKRQLFAHAFTALARAVAIATSIFGLALTLEEADEMEFTPENRSTIDSMLFKVDSLGCEGRDVGCDSFVFFNLLQDHPDWEAYGFNLWYGLRMMRALWIHGGGAGHILSVEKGTGVHWDHAVLMYYPGREFIGRLFKSSYFASIVEDKAQADTLVLATLPWRLPQ